MGWSRAELESFAGRTIPDLMPDDLRLLFVGINPGLVSAATGLHFARRGNRFYPALVRAGLVDTDDPALAAEQLRDRGVGITNLVARASARADELDPSELVEGRARLVELVTEYRPRVVAVAGITSFRTAFGHRAARPGRQPEDLAGAQVWVVPNPSGLNAHETVASLAEAYAEVARAAGVLSSL
ncbi:mismatch-specific DNA-glycosylase [Aeromicrobium duanguangcaii]|uniref:mismatch-specific DNA-glycosylase n=1 Tax=Aeromicrobium duanguangcaii TaxID=2968086 RepID=UPI00201791E4|nr:mismatch-specific DNA-glycosylase [Aeromicrobium duanguangcaii]MCL3836250.1 mismatch-specific DNA-glycosylase [Aeromicrobium duanguangcaii]